MCTVRSVIRTVWNVIEWQEVGSGPVGFTPFDTNIMKRGRGVKPGSPVFTPSSYGSNVLYGVWARYMHCNSPL